MIASILAVFTLASALGSEPPELLAGFQTLEECRIVKAQMQAQLADELKSKGLALACLNVKWEDA